MNIYLQQETIITIVVISVMVVALLLLVLKLLISNKKKQPKEKEILIDESYINNLYQALGTKTNILNISLDNKRLKVKLQNPKLIKKEDFDKLNTPAFLTGDELKILVKYDQSKVLSQLESLRKEG